MNCNKTIKKTSGIILILIISIGFCFPANSNERNSSETAFTQHPLKIGIDPNLPPYTYVDEHGMASGFDVELISTILNEQGISYEFYPDLWFQNFKKLKAAEIDVHPTVMQTAERESELDFSIPTGWFHIFLFIREGSPIKEIDDLEDSYVLIERDTIWDRWIAENKPHLRRMQVDTSEEALKKLSAGEADAAILMLDHGLYIKRKLSLSNVNSVGGQLFVFEARFALPEGSYSTLSKLNDGLIRLRQSGAYDAIYDKWFGVLRPTPWISKDATKLIAIIAAVLIGILATLVIWSQMLNRRVNEKTLELKTSLEKLNQDQLIIDSIPDMIWLKDTNNNQINVNKRAAESVGKTVEELKGSSAYELYPEEAEGYYQDDLEVIKSKKPKIGIVERLLDKGNKLWIRTDKYPIFDKDNDKTVTGILVIATDITKEKEVQDALERSEHLLSEAQKIAFVGSWEHEFVHDRLTWSEEAARIFGLDENTNELPYDESFSRIHPDDKGRVFSEYKKSVENKTKYNIYHRLIMRDGSIKYVNQICKTYYDADGSPMRSVGVIHDITTLKELETKTLQAQAHLAHADRLNTLGQLSSSIAHELNQPLSSVSQYCSSAKLRLKKISSEDNVLAEYIDNAIEQAQRAGNIIRQLRKLVTKQEPLRERHDVNKIICDSVELLQSKLHTSLVRVQLDLGDNLPEVVIDNVQIQQVIINLIHNSIDAMEKTSRKQRQLQVITSIYDERNILVSVLDNGAGIDKGQIDSVFEAYVSSSLDGLGLGLSICKSIIEAHDGKIWIDQEYSGGAKFNLLLQA